MGNEVPLDFPPPFSALIHLPKKELRNEDSLPPTSSWQNNNIGSGWIKEIRHNQFGLEPGLQHSKAVSTALVFPQQECGSSYIKIHICIHSWPRSVGGQNVFLYLLSKGETHDNLLKQRFIYWRGACCFKTAVIFSDLLCQVWLLCMINAIIS